ncbi:zf-TFIIB domain-containing protein [Undibacterium cyanobacteriorum]|uniref:Zf-TFIIB domain-containing protein n=1 Tax=Undibacterium cyanobacteriorum TaxID=3073561 RepID=A0ABY9REJ9_9BURK|nr:zf-TFIIB domain-containing protein [Undibacterium sp. 20NA77.5]WMW79657.1 zf-TFIIB domain-containing protein [Undibacterium sp. 20NA77.5]
MKCPVCDNVNLLMSERQGIEIDYCPQCRGIWLDRGELDKIIERSGSTQAASAQEVQRQAQPGIFSSTPNVAPQTAPQKHQQHYPLPSAHYKKKKEGFLSELFDFD